MKKEININKVLDSLSVETQINLLGYMHYSKNNSYNDLVTLRVLKKQTVNLYKNIDKYLNNVCVNCNKLGVIEKQNICKKCWKEIREDHISQDNTINSILED